MSNDFLVWIGLALCLLLSFLLSGMEAGVFALNRLRVRRLARSGNFSAQVLNRFLEKPEEFLWTILVGNTLVNFLFLGWSIAKLHAIFTGQLVVIIAIFGVVVFLFYSFFDLLPKMLFRTYPNRLCLWAARIFRIVYLLLRPFVKVAEGISNLALRWTGARSFTGRLFGNREELRVVMAQAAEALSDEEHAMVNRVLDLQHFKVLQISVPLVKTVCIEAHKTLRDALALAREKNLSRLPVWEIRDGKKRIAGLLDVTALLFVENLEENKPVAEFVSPAVFLEADTRVEIALRRMQRSGQRLAIVLTHDRQEAGIVSLEDILKLMFGEVKL
jgi:CBS domain containing-hemolysin-like protein